ncbi:MAG: hypothetical protein RIC30_07410 [Marinoscillum sp.]|uniref:hypothetical protein n=1 Tax=Marinoscillum sp. TaxID=2024838 RepID=UPI003301A49C
MKCTLMILMLAVVATAAAQPANDLKEYLEAVRKGSYDPVPPSVLKATEAMPLLDVLAAYEQDTIVRVRSRAYSIARRIGTKSEVPEVRATVVDQLTMGIGDPDGGISGGCSGGLTGFAPDDFSVPVKAQIQAYLLPATPHLDQVAMLIGYLGYDPASASLQGLLQERLSSTNKWSVRLALARMGDQESVTFIMEKLTAAAVSDNLVYDVVPGLVYTREPAIFEFLEQIIRQDEPLCQSADPDSSRKIRCGYRVLEYMAYAIEDFPIPTDEDGELELDDYEAGLQEVRAWFDSHETYSFKMDVY